MGVEVPQAAVDDPRRVTFATITDSASEEISKAALTDAAGADITASNRMPVRTKDDDYSTTGIAPRRVDLTAPGTPVLASASDAAWLNREITNPGDHDVWIGHTNGVRTSGATTGIKLEALNGNGSYFVPKEYRGNVYFDADSADAYVVVQEVK